MDFDEVLRVFLIVIKDWRVPVITAAVLVYLVIVVLVSGTRKKTVVKGFKMPKINIKMPKKKEKAADDEESEDEDDEAQRKNRK